MQQRIFGGRQFCNSVIATEYNRQAAVASAPDCQFPVISGSD